MITDPLFYAVAIPAVTLLGLAKGGFSGLGLLSLPLMALVISPVQAAAITLPILVVQDIVSVWAYRRAWDRRNILILIPAAATGILSGYLLAARVSDAAVALAVGVICVAFALRRMVLERGATPPFQIYVLPQRLPRDVFVGTGAIVFAMINWIKVPPYFLLGQLTVENLTTSGALFPVAIASTWAGVWLVRRVSAERFYTLIYILLVLVGAKLIYNGTGALL